MRHLQTGVFYVVFFSTHEIHIVYSTTIDKSLLAKTIKMWKKNIFYVFNVCVCMCVCEDKSENKTKQKQESTKNRWQMLFQVVCSLAHIYCLIAYVALLIFFVIHKQKHSRVYEYACTQTQTHRNTDIVQ